MIRWSIIMRSQHMSLFPKPCSLLFFNYLVIYSFNKLLFSLSLFAINYNHVLNFMNYFFTLLFACADCNIKQEAVARMFVELVWMYLDRSDRKGISQVLPQLLLLLLLLEALQPQGSFGLLNEFFPFGPVSDAVPPVCYFHICYVTFYIILPNIFRSS